jgi:hypothetical protein
LKVRFAGIVFFEQLDFVVELEFIGLELLDIVFEFFDGLEGNLSSTYWALIAEVFDHVVSRMEL